MSSSPLTRNVLANVLQMLAGAGLLFVLYRYINATLGVAQFGVWSVVLATASASRLANLGLGAGMTRFIARYLALEDRHTAARMIETSSVTLALVLALVLPALYVPLKYVLAHVFTGPHLAEAWQLLPYALLSLWLNDVAMVYQSGLEGFQRMDLRAGIVVAGQVLKLLLAFWLVPIHGLIGLAEAQIAQGVFLLLVGWIVLRRRLPQLGWLPIRWSRRAFRELIGYGANVQLASLFMMLMDPVAKALMAKFGGASAAGYFEMANQVVLKVRALIVTANQAIVPRVAALAETDPARLARLYCENMRTLVFVTLPPTALILAWAGGFSWLLTGAYQANLVFLLWLFAAAWGFNTFAGPAYFINMGTGRVGWNTLAHVLMGTINVALGWWLGLRYGAPGVASAYAIALVTGSGLLIAAFQKLHGIRWNQYLTGEHLGLACSCVAVSALGLFAPLRPAAGEPVPLTIGLVLPLLLLGFAVWTHPQRLALWRRFASQVA